MKKYAIPLIFIFLAGCSTLENFYQDNENIYGATIRVATAKVIDNDKDRAQRVAKVANIAQDLVNDETPLNLVEARIRSEIRWDDYTVDEQIIIDELLRVIRTEIEERVSLGVLDAEQRVLVSYTIEQVLSVAGRY